MAKYDWGYEESGAQKHLKFSVDTITSLVELF